MRLDRPAFIAFLAAAVPFSAAALVIEALPYGEPSNSPAQNSPEWTVIVFGGTSMAASAGVSTLTTGPGRGVWFGNGSVYGDTPAWSIGSPAGGNHLTLSASFSDARDWSAFLYDRNYLASIAFAPTDCNGNVMACYDATPAAGVLVAHAAGGDPSAYTQTFVPLNLSLPHSFEWLLKGGQVDYAIDGQLVYSGAAYATSGVPGWIANDGFLLIGDGSGSTPTGTGSMFIQGLAFDTAPALTSLVPEPATAALWAAGALALLARRRR